MKNTNPPPQTPVVKKTGMAQLLKRDKRQGSSTFNISKNRELQKLPLMKGTLFCKNFKSISHVDQQKGKLKILFTKLALFLG